MQMVQEHDWPGKPRMPSGRYHRPLTGTAGLSDEVAEAPEGLEADWLPVPYLWLLHRASQARIDVSMSIRGSPPGLAR